MQSFISLLISAITLVVCYGVLKIALKAWTYLWAMETLKFVHFHKVIATVVALCLVAAWIGLLIAAGLDNIYTIFKIVKGF